MENIISIIARILGNIVKAPDRILNLIPVFRYIYTPALPVLVVYGIMFLIFYYFSTVKSFKIENRNNSCYSDYDLTRGKIYKCPGIAKIAKILHKVTSVYVFLSVLYIFFSLLSGCGMKWIEEWGFWMLIVLVGVVMMLWYQIMFW